MLAAPVPGETIGRDPGNRKKRGAAEAQCGWNGRVTDDSRTGNGWKAPGSRAGTPVISIPSGPAVTRVPPSGLSR